MMICQIINKVDMTVAYLYDNCVDMSGWTSTGNWNVNSDAYISQYNAFHVGNGQFSTYSSSMTSTLTSPTFNLADELSGNNATMVIHSFSLVVPVRGMK